MTNTTSTPAFYVAQRVVTPDDGLGLVVPNAFEPFFGANDPGVVMVVIDGDIEATPFTADDLEPATFTASDQAGLQAMFHEEGSAAEKVAATCRERGIDADRFQRRYEVYFSAFLKTGTKIEAGLEAQAPASEVRS